MQKNNPKYPIGSELEHVKKMYLVAVRMIGRQIPLMTSQVIHICPNDYSDVKTMIFILTRLNLVGQVPFHGNRLVTVIL